MCPNYKCGDRFQYNNTTWVFFDILSNKRKGAIKGDTT